MENERRDPLDQAPLLDGLDDEAADAPADTRPAIDDAGAVGAEATEDVAVVESRPFFAL